MMSIDSKDVRLHIMWKKWIKWVVIDLYEIEVDRSILTDKGRSLSFQYLMNNQRKYYFILTYQKITYLKIRIGQCIFSISDGNTKIKINKRNHIYFITGYFSNNVSPSIKKFTNFYTDEINISYPK